MRNMYLILILCIMVVVLGCSNTDGTGVPSQQESGKQEPGTGGKAAVQEGKADKQGQADKQELQHVLIKAILLYQQKMI